ncbi:MAG: hypothetical protein H6839_00330 [Planctomycetes bacterium]|nr:hypothetical protein [Planctomycetota bacterium]
MRSISKTILGVAVLAAIAGTILIALPGAKPVTAPEPVKSPVQTAPLPLSEPAPGNVSPPAPEPEMEVSNLTIEDLVSGILAARLRQDRAWLARTMESTAGKPSLVEDDLLAAYRQYLWHTTDGLWGRVGHAWTERAYEVVEDGDRAQLVLTVGGSLGQLILPFVRIDGAWYYAGI